MKEILIHVSARTTRKDDDICRQQAANYNRFETASHVDILRRKRPGQSTQPSEDDNHASVRAGERQDEHHSSREEERLPSLLRSDAPRTHQVTQEAHQVRPDNGKPLQLLDAVHEQWRSSGWSNRTPGKGSPYQMRARLDIDFAENTQDANMAIEGDVTLWESQEPTEFDMSTSPVSQTSSSTNALPFAPRQTQPHTPDSYFLRPLGVYNDMMNSQLPLSYSLDMSDEPRLSMTNGVQESQEMRANSQIEESSRDAIAPKRRQTELENPAGTDTLNGASQSEKTTQSLASLVDDLEAESDSEDSDSHQCISSQRLNNLAGARSSVALPANAQQPEETATEQNLGPVNTVPRTTSGGQPIWEQLQFNWALVKAGHYAPYGEVNHRRSDDLDFMTPFLHQCVQKTSEYNVYPVRMLAPEHPDLTLMMVRGFWQFSTSHWKDDDVEVGGEMHRKPSIQWRFFDFVLQHIEDAQRKLDNCTLLRYSSSEKEAPPSKDELGLLRVITYATNAEAIYRFLYLASEKWLGRTHATFTLKTDLDTVIMEVPARHDREG